MSEVLKKVKYLLVGIIAVCLIFSTVGCEDKVPQQTETIQHEPKVYIEMPEDGDYDVSCIMVVMDKYSSEVNKDQSGLFLPCGLFSEIRDQLYTENEDAIQRMQNNEEFRQMLVLKLKEPSVENVKKALAIVMEIDGVLMASANKYMHIKYEALPTSDTSNNK